MGTCLVVEWLACANTNNKSQNLTGTCSSVLQSRKRTLNSYSSGSEYSAFKYSCFYFFFPPPKYDDVMDDDGDDDKSVWMASVLKVCQSVRTRTAPDMMMCG